MGHCRAMSSSRRYRGGGGGQPPLAHRDRNHFSSGNSVAVPMGWTSGFFGGGRNNNVDPDTDGNNFGFGAGSRAAAGDDGLLEDLEEDRTDLLRIILYGAFVGFSKIG